MLAAVGVLVAVELAFVAGWVLRADVEKLNRDRERAQRKIDRSWGIHG